MDRNKKYLILVPDGLADWALEELKNKTPLEYADTPNMDFIAKEGACGIAKTIPEGFEPGSDIANLTILGVDVKKYYTGRGPIEALAKNITGNIVFRCNLVLVKNNIMVDYSAGRISDGEASKVIGLLNEKIDIDYVKFYPSKSYRNLLVINKDYDEKVKTVPPHDIINKNIDNFLPKNKSLANLLIKLIKKSKEIVSEATDKANMIWPWSGGKMPNFPKIKDRNLTGAMISEVDLLKGIGKGLGMIVFDVEGATGYIDTNYKGLAKTSIKCLQKYDLVVLHTEGIDEVSHEGDLEKKIEAIEIYDEKIVGYILDRVDLEELRILLIPDHPTPIKIRTHAKDPVPFAIYGCKRDDVKVFSEKACAKGRFGFINGLLLLELLTKYC